MATLVSYFSTSATIFEDSNAYKLEVSLGTIENLSPPIEINLMVVPIPTLGPRSSIVMDINGMTEKYDIEAFVINGGCSVTLYRFNGAHWHNAYAEGTTLTLDTLGWGNLSFTTGAPTLTDSASFVQAMRRLGVQQLFNYSPGSTEESVRPSVAGGGVFLTTTATDTNTNAFPVDTLARCYLSDFSPKYIAGIPNCITYTMSVTMAASLV